MGALPASATAEFAYHYEASAVVRARAEDVFRFVDDPMALASHMGKSSWRTGGGRMSMEFDAGGGRVPGSRIVMRGSVMGLQLELEEIVYERDVPRRKTWATVGTPRLLVIGHYRMGFSIEPAAEHSSLRVFIDYELPAGGLPRLLGLLFAGFYARWCVDRMLDDAARHFSGISEPLT